MGQLYHKSLGKTVASRLKSESNNLPADPAFNPEGMMMVILPAEPMAAGIPDVLVEQEDAIDPKKTKRTSDGRLEIFMLKAVYWPRI